MELAALQAALPEIAGTGAGLVAISPQLPENTRKIVAQHHLTFPVLRDQGNRIAGQYGLVFSLPEDLRQVYRTFGVDLPKFNGDESWTLPMPGRFIIGRDGTIRGADVDPDYTIRPEPARSVEVLRRLAGADERIEP
ncbi:MAG TPA: peroxiredoxin-like family protein [Candidatus Methylomirabilis sp.]|nr:peroxiredoxin-like family protein [Candidatus Methylomirabilis sp.]